MRFLSEDEVRRRLPMAKAIAALRQAFLSDESRNQPRRRLILPGGTVLHSMAGAVGPYLGTKIYSTNAKYGAHFHFLLYEAATGRPLCLMDANALGQIRTGAATGVAVELLGPVEATSCAIIGSGFQAWTQLEAVHVVRKLTEVRVYGRDEQRRRDFAARARDAFGLNVEAASSAERAVRGADLVVTATNAKDPVIEDQWLKPGAFVAAMGSNQANRRELPSDTILRAELIAVDSMEQAKIEAGDLLLAKPHERWVELPLIELRELLKTPPASPGGLRIFKSLGIGIEDVAAAAVVWES